MKIPDLNVLIYAYDESAAHHARCRDWLERSLSATETIGFAWIVVVGFVRLTTSRRIFEDPMTIEESVTVADSWLAQPCATVVEPGRGHLQRVGELLGSVGTAGNLTNDAHLAEIAIEHHAEIVSCDDDFARFARAVFSNPTR